MTIRSHRSARRAAPVVEEEGNDLPVAWLDRSMRYVEKLATPDVTIADMIGDIDPIKAAAAGRRLSDELTVHYGLVPRANRCIFAINELPDLAGKIQGRPVQYPAGRRHPDPRLSGTPAARYRHDVHGPTRRTTRPGGKSSRRSRTASARKSGPHYPRTRHEAIAITEQEAWVARGAAAEVVVPLYVREVVEEIAFQARANKRIDGRSGVSQRMPITCLENVVSNAERRALATSEAPTARVTDVYAALPSITGKFELEYEGELRGADAVGRELIRTAVGAVFGGWFDGVDTNQVVEWFEMGGTLQESDTTSSEALLADVAEIHGLLKLAAHARRCRRRPAGADRLGRRFRAGGTLRSAQDQPQ